MDVWWNMGGLPNFDGCAIEHLKNNNGTLV